MIDQHMRPTWRPSDPVPSVGATVRPRHGTAWFAMMITAIFSAVQLWAILVVLVMVHTTGVATVALFCLLVGSAAAICLAVRVLRVISARERAAQREQRQGGPEHIEYVLR